MAAELQVGIVGFGKAARIFHAPLIAACAGLRLAFVVERHGSQARALYPEVAVVRSVEALVRVPEVDLVVIATPNQTHAALARTALQAGKHVVVDKPLAVSADEAAMLRDLARERGRVLSVFHNRRWDGGFRTVREIVASGLVGDVVEYEACYDRFRDTLRPGAWREAPQPGAGLLYDLGAHLIDQALVLFGRPAAVGAELYRQRPGAETDDAFAVRLHYAALTATLRAGMLLRQPRPLFRVVGSRGNYVKLGPDPQEAALAAGRVPAGDTWGREPEAAWGTLDTAVEGMHVVGRVETRAGCYPAYYANVRDAIRGTAPLAVTAAEGRRVIQLIEWARQSAAARCVVECRWEDRE